MYHIYNGVFYRSSYTTNCIQEQQTWCVAQCCCSHQPQRKLCKLCPSQLTFLVLQRGRCLVRLTFLGLLLKNPIKERDIQCVDNFMEWLFILKEISIISYNDKLPPYFYTSENSEYKTKNKNLFKMSSNHILKSPPYTSLLSFIQGSFLWFNLTCNKSAYALCNQKWIYG